METQKISRLATLILKGEQNNFNEIKETQDKKVILNQNKTQLFCGQIDEQRSANRS